MTMRRENIRARQEDIRRNPQFRKIRQAVWKKWRDLARDKEFVWETARLKLHLTLAFGRNPEETRAFFDPTFELALTPASRIQSLSRMPDVKLRAVLRRYLRYVSRFGVKMRLHEDAPHFRTRGSTGNPATKFHVRAVGNSFEPTDLRNDDGHTSASDLFASDALAVGVEMQKLIDTGAAKYVLIEDTKKSSVLSQLSEFASSPNALTFVVVESKQPYLLCLIGENVPLDTTWREASKVVAEFQKIHYGRARAGRPPALRKLRKQLAVILRNKNTTDAAMLLREGDTAKDVYSKMSLISQIKRKLAI